MVNDVTLIGRLGVDPEIKAFENSTKISLRIATTEWFKDEKSENGFREKTQWHNVVVWEKQITKTRELKKGEMVYVKGKIEYNEFEAQDGTKKYFTSINGKVKRISTSGQRTTDKDAVEGYFPPNNTQSTGKAVEETDDLPF